ncbi:MAG: type I glyceraldehyde-3-phosphate dehydrogenase [Rickettsiella sp.]|nr:type I glyceraldehyde-3-phosphate dehydrogenase [Rickettsiella sp.]
MTTRVAINGYGRIGRNIVRALFESPEKHNIEIIAINDLGDININAYLTRHDTTHGKFSGTVIIENDHLVINGHKIKMLSERDPEKLPWKSLNIDVVHECTGFFTSREKATKHINAGAKKVIISAPAGKDVDATIVYGVNHTTLKATDIIISNASCTTNCLAPLVKPLHEKLGIVQGLMTTIHAYTNDQVLLDTHHSDMRRARSATQSMIPTKTGAASAVGLVLPELAGRLDGLAIRVPTINVSLVDLSFQAVRKTTIDEVNKILKEASEEKALKGLLNYSEEPLVSIDFNHNSASSTVDATQTRVIGDFIKVLAWYDNEWGFSNRMLDVTTALMNAN